MIITRTPFRMSFFGGGSDLKAFYGRRPGAVLSTSINLYMYLSAHPFWDQKSFSLKYSKNELAPTREAIAHPIIKRVMERLDLKGGIEITSTADIPAGTGLGSSSSFTVGLLNLIYAYQGRHVSQERLAAEASDIEINDLGAPIGKQDQYAAACGGMNFIRFFPDESVDVRPLVITRETRQTLESSLLMFFTGEQRSASGVLAEQKAKLTSNEDTFTTMGKMVDLADDAKDVLEKGDVAAFGTLLDRAWQLKRSVTSGISMPLVDEMYAKAMEAGAWGGKLLGAGGGGFLLIAAPVSVHSRIRDALQQRREMRVRFEHGGSRVLYMSEEV